MKLFQRIKFLPKTHANSSLFPEHSPFFRFKLSFADDSKGSKKSWRGRFDHVEDSSYLDNTYESNMLNIIAGQAKKKPGPSQRDSEMILAMIEQKKHGSRTPSTSSGDPSLCDVMNHVNRGRIFSKASLGKLGGKHHRLEE